MAEHFQGQGQTMQRLEGIGGGLSIGSLSKSGREITGSLVINPINETRRVFNQSERELLRDDGLLRADNNSLGRSPTSPVHH